MTIFSFEWGFGVLGFWCFGLVFDFDFGGFFPKIF